jgi:hypothetical protein
MITLRPNRGTAAAFAMLALFAVAGCSNQEQDIVPETNTEAPVETPAPVTEEPAVAAPEPARPVEEPANLVAPPPEEPIAPDAQMLDDADATGMTARLSREDAVESDDAAPAETDRQQ